MIVQACLNGARPEGYHPKLPATPNAIAEDARACVLAGAAELHIHPRAADGRESLAAVDETVRAVRLACPGTLIGVSTGAWIENDRQRTDDCIAAWRCLPDYASVNLGEKDAPAILALLETMGVGVEAGLASIADAERFVALPGRRRALRILIEIEEQDLAKADALAGGIEQVLQHADVARPILLHGMDATVWHFVRRARDRGWSTRVGLEDGRLRISGETASGNAEIVADAVAVYWPQLH